MMPVEQPDVQDVEFNFGSCLSRVRNLQGDKDGAERYMKRALEEAKRGFGEQDGHVAAAYNNLAEIYRNMKQFDKAEPLYLEVRSV